MKLLLVATLIVVASALETEHKDKRQVLLPGALGYGGLGYGGVYPGFLGAGVYPGYIGGYPGIIGRKRRALDESAEEVAEPKEKRQIATPYSYGLAAGALPLGVGVGYPGFYGAGLYGGYPAIIGRKRREIKERAAEDEEGGMTGHHKRQVLAGGVYPGVGYPAVGYPGVVGAPLVGAPVVGAPVLGAAGLGYGVGGVGLGAPVVDTGYGLPTTVVGRKRRGIKEERAAEDEEGGMMGHHKRQVLAGGVYPGVGYPGVGYPGVVGAPLVGAPVVGAPVVGAPVLGAGLGYGGVGLGAPVVDTGYGLPTTVVGRKRRDLEAEAEEEPTKEKRHVVFPGALGLGYGYPGFLGGGFYPGFYGAGLYGGYPAAIL